MDQAEKTMMENIHKKTGKSVEEWIKVVGSKNFSKHSEIVSFLKDEHGFTYGYATLVAHKSRGSDAGSADDSGALIEKQYKGKEHFKPLYDHLVSEIHKLGKDIETAPKNAYVSFRRKRQFVTLQPAAKTRFEIGLNLKGVPADGILQPSSNAMCSHRINLDSLESVTPEVLGWIKKAYEKAG